MSILSENELKTQIKSRKFQNFYLLYGEENFLTEHYTNLLLSKILDNNKNSFNFKAFIKNKFSIEELEKSAEAVSFFGGNKCILVKDLDFSTLSSNDIKKLKQVISDLAEYVFLIVSQVNIETDKKRSNAFNSFVKFAEKSGAVLELKKLNIMALEKQLVAWAKRLSKDLSLDNASRIVDSCKDGLMDLKNEIEKLCAYSENEITKEAIDSIVVKKLEANVFELTKLIAANQFSQALTKLNILLKMKESPIAILSILSGYYIDLYRVKVFKNCGESLSTIKEFFPEYSNREFRLTNAQRDCEKLSLNGIKKIIELLVCTDLQLKSSSLNKGVLMEKLFIKVVQVYKS